MSKRQLQIKIWILDNWNDSLNRNVLIKVLKDSKFVASRANACSLFHRKGAATWKALSLESAHLNISNTLFSQLALKCPLLSIFLLQDSQEISEETYSVSL